MRQTVASDGLVDAADVIRTLKIALYADLPRHRAGLFLMAGVFAFRLPQNAACWKKR
ncbi:hypothetical protein USDA257_c19660 [Sinorhizobium fredii USDA 257]|uniref:Uncharacterized protein n=1 Tax=Sinorhizobium fredii (strain USDA 257) TaxID=1185652 RepID=I3X3U5_SINF2|nr:hypothetical protein USDA257_c19660 [Sinorhizobium fredii USDA 257]